jgi:hypothetical protein
VQNNPINWIDPSGHAQALASPSTWTAVGQGLAAIAAGIVGFFSTLPPEEPTVIPQPIQQPQSTVIEQPITQEQINVTQQPIVQQQPTVIQTPVEKTGATILFNNLDNYTDWSIPLERTRMQHLKSLGFSGESAKEVSEAFTDDAKVVETTVPIVVKRYYKKGYNDPRGKWLTTEEIPFKQTKKRLALPGQNADAVEYWTIQKQK